IDATTASLGEGGRLWAFGGAALLTVPGTRLMAVDLPRVPRVYEAHRTNLAGLQRSRLDWSMLCPGPMIASENGKPTPNLRLAADEWPMARPTYTSGIWRPVGLAHQIDPWNTSIRTPLQLTWTCGSGLARRPWRDRSAPPPAQRQV